MKRLIFWFVVGIAAVSLFRTLTCNQGSPPPPCATEQAREGPGNIPVEPVIFVREPDDERESVEGLAVPIVPGTRVSEAEIETPEPPCPNRPKPAPTPAPALPTGTRLVKGQLSATEDRARAEARVQLERKLAEWLVPDIPPSWKVPEPLVNRPICGEQVKAVEKDYGTLYEATLQVRITPELRAEIVEAYRRELVAHRLAVLAGVIGFILACLAALAGYIRADEATKGYYTNWLRAAAAAGVGAVSMLIYQMLT
ncbi:MAG TPA: hypothetical protein VKP69_01390 [Isosphaeraceae bacterium]|nr:hypothetical protein [Isosphaeraceae bacterium]